MWKKILKFFLWLLIFTLVAAAVTGIVLYLGNTLEDALVVNGIVFGVWFLLWLLRRIYVRLRARAQAKRVINEDEPDPEMGIPTRELLRNLRLRWQGALRSLKRSELRRQGNPLYVLPWYIVMGRPRSGKSTAMKNARLLSPLLESLDHDNGQTRNLDLWLYEDAIVIDTAGRYAVPDNAARDRLEWATLLGMLARHKEREPLNGVVVVVAADRLLKCSEAELMEEGRQVRASLNELMTRLEVKLPVYVMITKADLVPGFTAWAEHFPDEVTAQALGTLLEDERGTIAERLNGALDALIMRMKELRLVLLDRKRNIDPAVLSLSETLDGLRRGLVAFADGALAENAYQETPYLRGLFMSSSEQSVNDKKDATTQPRGLFLKEFFTRVMPPDRDLLRTLPQAERLRRLALQYGTSVASIAVVLAFVAMAGLFFTDLRALDTLRADADPVTLNDDNMVDRFYSLAEIRALIEALDATEADWLLPWALPGDETLALGSMKRRYLRTFETGVLDLLDQRRRALVEQAGPGRNVSPDRNVSEAQRGDLLLGLAREINLIEARLAASPPQALPALPSRYLALLEAEFSNGIELEFHQAFLDWLAWQQDDAVLRARSQAARSELLATLQGAEGSVRWLTELANRQGLDEVTLDEFWPGTARIDDAPRVAAAYTLAGRDFIQGVLAEIDTALAGDTASGELTAALDENYRNAYLDAWRNFASRFDTGMQRLGNRQAWTDLLNQFPLDTNPYFALLGRMQAELAPYAPKLEEDPALMLVGYFAEMQAFTGAGGEGGGANTGAAAKLGLKLLGKTGKAGKAVAGVAKKGLRTGKKVRKIAGKKGASKEDLDNSLEQAATALKDYKKALADVAFAADARQVSYDTAVVAFESPTTPESGSGPVGSAYTAINALQAIAGRPYEANELFWQLYTGPARLAQHYMTEEANCHLDDSWQTAVRAEADGVSSDKLPALLIGEAGLVWEYVAGPAAPFLEKRAGRGYLPRESADRHMKFTDEFLDFVNAADSGRRLLGDEYIVTVTGQPTSVNDDALLLPDSTVLELQCASGPQVLTNFNFPVSTDFTWSLADCGDVTLTVSIGRSTLRRSWTGEKAFPRFLTEFRSGRASYPPAAFPGEADALAEMGITRVTVNFGFEGQQPVQQMLAGVPIDLPKQAAACWGT